MNDKRFHLDLPEQSEPTDSEPGRWQDREYRKDYRFFSGVAQPKGVRYGRQNNFRE